ncbi:hypothetical protein NMY22_g2955 [Coprinellus aureogranulatus]|nr:hypothetical protein NMY22_g2955 [Coprinellus aureogranulatus]
MKVFYSPSLTILAVILTESARITAIPTPFFAPFAIGFRNPNHGSQQQLAEAAKPQESHIVDSPERVSTAPPRPHDPPTSSSANQALEDQNRVNQIASSITHAIHARPTQQSAGLAHPSSPPPPQEAHLQAQQQGLAGPPPMPSLPFHTTVPATLPNTPPFQWHPATIHTASQSAGGLSSPTVSLQTLEPSATAVAPTSLETAGGRIDDEGAQPGGQRSRRLGGLSIVGIVLGTLGGLTLLIFMLMDPRVSRTCRGQSANSKGIERIRSSKGLGKRPISSWFPFPSSHHQHSSPRVSRKAVSGQRRGLDMEARGNSEHTSLANSCPRSKFSITSSDYENMSRASTSSADTVLVENTRANESIPPIRPPRPPTADSPATISDSVFFAPENQIYMEPVCPSKEDVSKPKETGLPLGRPLIPPGTFFTKPSGSLSSTSTAVASPALDAGLGVLQQRRHGLLGQFGGSSSGFASDSSSDSESRMPYNLSNGGLYSSLGLFNFGSISDALSTGEESRHSRRHSAPLFTGNPVHDSYQPMYMDPVARKVLKHRRSRSNSGWAYPRRKGTNGSFLWSSDTEESYHGAYGQAL